MKNDNIKTFIENLVSGDLEKAREAFSSYCNDKAGEVVKSSTEPTLSEGWAKRVNDMITALMEDQGAMVAPGQAVVSMDGNKVVVNGKVVGRVADIDLNDWDAGINFVSMDGSFSKEFDTAEDLFRFISQKYLGEK